MNDYLLNSRIDALISHKWLLIDANFLIDASKTPNTHLPIIEFLKDQKAELVTIAPVRAEFLRGASNLDEFEKLNRYINSICPVTLPIDDTINDNVLSKIIPVYRRAASSASVVDLFLAGTLMKYEKKLMLLTANHKDFPTYIFDRLAVIPIETESTVRTFGIYLFSPQKYESALERILR